MHNCLQPFERERQLNFKRSSAVRREMEPSSGGKKIFRARKTMNPSSRQQIESLNKLKDILEKERVSKETNKEYKTVPFTKQDDTNCENDLFGQIFKVESKTLLSEEKDVSPNQLKVSVEVLGIDSSVAACSLEKDICHFNHQTAQSLSPSEVKPYTLEKPPLSNVSIENPLIQNILNDIYDQEAGVLSEHSVSTVASKLQDSLSRKLHDMLAQEKKLIATTAPIPLEADCENDDAMMTDRVLPVSEKIVIPLNLSEGDEDEGLLPVLERMNAKVYRNIENQADGAVSLQDLHPSLPDKNPVSQSGGISIPCSVQLPINTLDTDVKREIISIPDDEKVKCLDESKTFPQKDTKDINPVSQSEGVTIPCSVQILNNNTLDTDVKRDIISIPDNEKVKCLDESKTFPQKGTININPVSQSEGVTIPCSVQLTNNSLDTNVKREIISKPDGDKLKCLHESKIYLQQDTMDVDLNNKAFDEPESKTNSDLDGTISLPQKDTLANDLEGKDTAECANKNLSCLDADATSKKETLVDNLNNAALCTYFNESISCQGPEVSSQNIDSSMELVIGSFHRKRLNSGNESSTCKRFKSTDDDSSKSEKINGISEKVKLLINRQLQIFFSDVFDERLEQLTERVKQIQCGQRHEELAAKCLHKLRRFEKNANIAVKSMKELLRQRRMESLTTEPKATVPRDNVLTVQQALLIDRTVPVNEVTTSTTTKACLPLYLQATSSAQFASTVSETTTANAACFAYGHDSSTLKSSMLVSASRNVPGHVDFQKVSSCASRASWNSKQAESGTETVVLDERHESESFSEKVRLKSLTSSIPDGLSRKASTDKGSVLNGKSNYEVSIEEMKKGSGIVIDLTEEESSSKRAVTIKDQDSSLKIQNLHCKQIETTGTKSVWSLKNVNDHKISAFLGMQKLLQSNMSPQRSNLEHLNSSEVTRVLVSTNSNPSHETTKELGQKSFGVSETAAKPKFDKSNYGEIENPNLELKGMQKRSIVPLATHSKNVEKTSQKLALEKRTTVESSAKPISTVLTDSRRAQYMSQVGSVLENKTTSFPSSLTSQEKETTKKSNQAMERCFQPSTLTQPELRVGVKDSLPPQKIDLKLTQVQNPRGIALSWNCAECTRRLTSQTQQRRSAVAAGLGARVTCALALLPLEFPTTHWRP
ncbi:hypothetical protein NDU88_002600 [Pleurodeles waltl]|uniref:ATF7-interacting protein protein binding domain-containing protein n=1 Tax=Pleurodeles waltl TaxID=8319 RepID=A0AAV7M1F9_PLEWA|nr:hypothetical protein NDU88_002600 [Pleurodeles waltl]